MAREPPGPRATLKPITHLHAPGRTSRAPRHPHCRIIVPGCYTLLQLALGGAKARAMSPFYWLPSVMQPVASTHYTESQHKHGRYRNGLWVD